MVRTVNILLDDLQPQEQVTAPLSREHIEMQGVQRVKHPRKGQNLKIRHARRPLVREQASHQRIGNDREARHGREVNRRQHAKHLADAGFQQRQIVLHLGQKPEVWSGQKIVDNKSCRKLCQSARHG